MYYEIIYSKIGLIIVIGLALFISFYATKLDERLIKANISSPSLLMAESLSVVLAIALGALVIPSVRSKIYADFSNLLPYELFLLGLYAVLGFGLTLITNELLVYHGTNEYKMYELIIGLLVTSALYFATKEKYSINKIVYFIIMAIFAILFSLE